MRKVHSPLLSVLAPGPESGLLTPNLMAIDLQRRSLCGQKGPTRREEKRRKGGLNEGQDLDNYSATEVACNVAKFSQLIGQRVVHHCAPRKADKRRRGGEREGRKEQ